jgi:hypothetical protein
MTHTPTNSNSNSGSDTGSGAATAVTGSPREYLYFVSYATSTAQLGNCYLSLTFTIESAADVDWVRGELVRQGLTGAVVLSFALLSRGWGRR